MRFIPHPLKSHFIHLLCLMGVLLLLTESIALQAQDRYIEHANKSIERQDADELKILSWNIYMLPRFALITGKRKRAKHIGNMLPQMDYDIIVFQEAFHPRARRHIYKRMKSDYPYKIGPLNRGRFTPAVSNGGIWILSKTPIEKIGSCNFKSCDRDDCFARKGGLLVSLDWKGQEVQILGTHLEAGGPDMIYYEQYQELNSLLESHKKEGVPQILCGDFNTSYKSKKYKQMMATLLAKNGPFEGELQYTIDDQNDIRNSDSNGYIDYIFYKANGTPAKDIKRRVVFFTEPWGKTQKFLSDHNGVEMIVRW